MNLTHFQKSQKSTPYKPLAFGGLWKDEQIDDHDIDEVRREMWQRPLITCDEKIKKSKTVKIIW